MNAEIPHEAIVERARVRLDTSLKGKYRLDRVLGVGGMATVYAATHRNGKEFAIKVLHPELSVIGEIRSRFLREGYLANRVKHPGAVAVLDDDVTDDGSAFLVMELLHGENVESLWERHGRHLPLEFVAGIGLQLLEVLDAAHQRGVVHRDIKPENLLLLSDGLVKVLDFGIARVRGAAVGHATEPGFAMGTPAFMAPEQALAELGEVDAQTDLWAAAATMFTLVSGEIVHGCGSSQQVLLRAATEKAPPLAQISPSAPRELCAVVDRGLAFSKADRWGNAADMRRALQAAAMTMFGQIPGPGQVARVAKGLDDTPTVPPQTDEPSATSTHSVPRKSGRTRGRFVGFGAAAAVVLVPAVLFLASARRTESGHPRSGTTSTLASTVATRPGSPALEAIPREPEPAVSLAPVIQEVEADQLPSAAAPKPAPLRPKANAMPPAVAAPQAAPSASPKRPSCTPPYEFDSNGNKRWKRECL